MRLDFVFQGFSGTDLSQHVQVDVPSGKNDAHRFEFRREFFVKQRGGGHCAAGLGEQFHARKEEAHGSFDFFFRNKESRLRRGRARSET